MLECPDSLEAKFVDLLDETDRQRAQKAMGLHEFPERHVGCGVTAEIRQMLVYSSDSRDVAALAAGHSVCLIVRGFHHDDCAATLYCLHHLCDEMVDWCNSMLQLGINQLRIRETIDGFLSDRDGFAGTLFLFLIYLFIYLFSVRPWL